MEGENERDNETDALDCLLCYCFKHATISLLANPNMPALTLLQINLHKKDVVLLNEL
jgi:hypothetical protein